MSRSGPSVTGGVSAPYRFPSYHLLLGITQLCDYLLNDVLSQQIHWGDITASIFILSLVPNKVPGAY